MVSGASELAQLPLLLWAIDDIVARYGRWLENVTCLHGSVTTTGLFYV
jgi:hypothetical protein